MTKTALITGISGQDGSYLAELLLQKKYHVVGFIKNKERLLSPNIQHLSDQIHYVIGDLNDSTSIENAINSIQPDEIYNLASQSYPSESWKRAIETMQVNGFGAHQLFEAVRKFKQDCRIYQASSSEMFGSITETPQNESTPFHPINPYAAAKVYAHHIAKIYRQSFNLFISCGILFNHESPRRGMHFITQKITYAAACLKMGILNSPILNEKNEPIVKNGKLSLGNLDAQRDWGYAGDYVEAMWLILQQPDPHDFVIGSGQMNSIRQLCATAFRYVGLDWENYVITDRHLTRPIETGSTVADTTKAKTILQWQPKKSFTQLVHDLVDYHLNLLQKTLP